MFPFWGCTWFKKIEIAPKWIIFVQWNCHLWPKSKLEGREGEKNRSQKIRLNLRQLMDCLSHKTYLVDKISGFENNWHHFIFILKKIKTDLSSVLERERIPFLHYCHTPPLFIYSHDFRSRNLSAKTWHWLRTSWMLVFMIFHYI